MPIKRPAQLTTVTKGGISSTPSKLRPTPRVTIRVPADRVVIREKPARGRAWPVA